LGGKHKTAFVDTQDDGWAAIREAQHRCPKSRIVTIGDCAGEMAALFEEALQQKCGSLVRAKGNESQLRPYLQGLPEAGEVALFPAREGARSARLGVRFAPLAAKPDLPLWAVWARERHPPQLDFSQKLNVPSCGGQLGTLDRSQRFRERSRA